MSILKPEIRIFLENRKRTLGKLRFCLFFLKRTMAEKKGESTPRVLEAWGERRMSSTGLSLASNEPNI